MTAFNERKVKFMSKEAISRVLLAETEANAIRKRAEKEARARVEACEKECEERNARLAEKNGDRLDDRLESVRKRAVTLIIQSRDEVEGDIEAMRLAAQDKSREAIKLIEWEFCNI